MSKAPIEGGRGHGVAEERAFLAEPGGAKGLRRKQASETSGVSQGDGSGPRVHR